MKAANVIDLWAYRNAKAKGETNRSELNEVLTQRIVEHWWDDSTSYDLFNTLLKRALKGPLFTPERARALLPTLLDVVDEMDEADREEALDQQQIEVERQQQFEGQKPAR
jgi:hypothetical protein